MAVTRRTITLSRGMRVHLDSTVDAATAEQVRAWARAWRTLESAWSDAIADLITDAQLDAAGGAAAWPSRGKVLRARRVLEALEKSRVALDGLAEASGVTITGRLSQLVADATTAHAEMIASQLPPGQGPLVDVAVRFNRVDANQLAAIVNRSTQQVTALHYYLAPAATEAMKEAIVRGVALGDNPRTAARRMLARTKGTFNGGLTRANVIARTEMLDAHREAGRITNMTNADTLAGWVWSATLDRRTCPSCWAQHGSVHAVSELGPLDHQQGRCVAIPKTKTWAELGFVGIDEPPDVTPDGQTTFRALPEADQLAIMGPARLAGLRDGSITWEQLSQRRATAGWRDSYVPRAVKDLVAVK